MHHFSAASQVRSGTFSNICFSGNDELHCSHGCDPQYGLCGPLTISRVEQFSSLTSTIAARITISAPSPGPGILTSTRGVEDAPGTDTPRPTSASEIFDTGAVQGSTQSGIPSTTYTSGQSTLIRPITRITSQSLTIAHSSSPTLDATLDVVSRPTRDEVSSRPSSSFGGRTQRTSRTLESARSLITQFPLTHTSTRSGLATSTHSGESISERPSATSLLVYTPIASLPWWQWGDPSEGGDGLLDGDGNQDRNDEDDGSDEENKDADCDGNQDADDEDDGSDEEDEYVDGDGTQDWDDEDDGSDEEDEHVDDDWETDLDDEVGDEHGDGYQHGDGHEHCDECEVGIGDEKSGTVDDNHCDCSCDWWWTDDEDSSGEGIDWDWVTEDVISWESAGTCHQKPSPTPTPTLVSGVRNEDRHTDTALRPNSTPSVPPQAATPSDNPGLTWNHDSHMHRAAGQNSKPDKPQSWHDGILNTELQHHEDDPKQEWSDGALHHA
jgi:hypothetical protein